MTYGTVLNSFSAAFPERRGRRFDGFSDRAGVNTVQRYPRETHHICIQDGDLLSIDGACFVVCLDDAGRVLAETLGLKATAPVPWAEFDSERLSSWITANGGQAADLKGTFVPESPEPVILRANGKADVWILNVCRRDDIVAGGAGDVLTLSHTRLTPDLTMLAPYLGDVVEEFTVPRGTALAYGLERGQILQIIDVEGQQCSDFQATRKRALDRAWDGFIDATATHSMTGRAFPGPGLFDKFYDAEMSPLIRVVQDTCGRHDTFGLACTERGYADRGFPGHLNCSDNIAGALDPYGVKRRRAWPAINFFWNTWLDQHHHLRTEESYSRPGDYVAMEAMDDLVCVTTACPDDIDPINGWNPTDVHVRIYKPDPSLRRAIAYRPKEDAPMRVSDLSPFHERLVHLTEQFAPARDLWSPVAFPGIGTLGEYWACREAVTLQDMSGLRKLDIVGPDAERLLQMAMTRDVARLPDWRATYALMCDEAGEIIDDGTLFRMGPQLFRWCYGAEESARWLQQLATDKGLHVRLHDLGSSLPNLALQGPKSRDLLRDVIFTQPHVPALDQIRWFGLTMARLHNREGVPFLLSRTGYTGELGYEIFCAKADALTIWDALMDAGQAYGIEPMGSAALETLRIEAGFASAGAEFAPGSDAIEAGLGFAVDFKKADFIGKAALERNLSAERKRLVGLRFETDDVPLHGAPVWAGERQVGVVTSATRSPSLECAIAMARVGIEHASEGKALEVGQMDGRMKRLTATVCPVPFVDPKRERARG